MLLAISAEGIPIAGYCAKRLCTLRIQAPLCSEYGLLGV